METDRLIRLMPPKIQDKSWRTWLKQSSKSETSVVGKKLTKPYQQPLKWGCWAEYAPSASVIQKHVFATTTFIAMFAISLTSFATVKKPRELGESIEPVMHSLVLPAKNAKAVDLAVTGSPAARHFGYHVAALAKRGAPQLGLGSPPTPFFLRRIFAKVLGPQDRVNHVFVRLYTLRKNGMLRGINADGTVRARLQPMSAD